MTSAAKHDGVWISDPKVLNHLWEIWPCLSERGVFPFQLLRNFPRENGMISYTIFRSTNEYTLSCRDINLHIQLLIHTSHDKLYINKLIYINKLDHTGHWTMGSMIVIILWENYVQPVNGM